MWVNVISQQAEEDLTSLLTIRELNYNPLVIELTFDTYIPKAKVAFVLSHTSWEIDSLYGQFKGLYETITQSGIAVEEIHDRSEILVHNLLFYNAVIVLDLFSRNLTVSTGPYSQVATGRAIIPRLLFLKQPAHDRLKQTQILIWTSVLNT